MQIRDVKSKPTPTQRTTLVTIAIFSEANLEPKKHADPNFCTNFFYFFHFSIVTWLPREIHETDEQFKPSNATITEQYNKTRRIKIKIEREKQSLRNEETTNRWETDLS